MCNELQLIPGAISAMLASVTETGTITSTDRFGLMAACLDDSLDEDERRAVNRILHSIVRGTVKVA